MKSAVVLQQLAEQLHGPFLKFGGIVGRQV